MSAAPQDDAADERLELFTTLRDWFRHAVSRFNAAGLAYGHGTTRAVDEAAFIVLEGLRLPIDQLDPFFDAKLVPEERRRLAELIDARIATRKPAAYLLGRAYIQGVPFYVDERVIVPRSFIGELLFAGLVGEGGLIAAPEAVASVLDLCTGGASLAVLAARASRTLASMPWTCRPTRSKWRGAMSPTTDWPNESRCFRAISTNRSASGAMT